jgi:hypothetical protein
VEEKCRKVKNDYGELDTGKSLWLCRHVGENKDGSCATLETNRAPIDGRGGP